MLLCFCLSSIMIDNYYDFLVFQFFVFPLRPIFILLVSLFNTLFSYPCYFFFPLVIFYVVSFALFSALFSFLNLFSSSPFFILFLFPYLLRYFLLSFIFFPALFWYILHYSINDPGIWRIKCVPGKEMMLVRSILLKALASRVRGEKG